MAGKTVHDDELKAMAVIQETLDALYDDDAIRRVLGYVNSRHGHLFDPQPPVARLDGQHAGADR